MVVTEMGSGLYARTDKVLQYRVRHFRASLPYSAGFEGWGAWQNVPTVSDDGDKSE